MQHDAVVSILVGIKQSIGKDALKRAYKEAMSEIPVDREKRKPFSRAFKQKLFDRQGGVCLECHKPLIVPAIKNEVDHIQPDAEDWHNTINLRLTHPKCNRSKGAKSLVQLSKERGGTVLERLQP